MPAFKKKRRRTGANRPIDFSSFPDEALLLYARNLEYHIRKGDLGHSLLQYTKIISEAGKRELLVTDCRTPDQLAFLAAQSD